MNIAILISGALRSYSSALEPFLNKLPENFHIFLSCSEETEDQYLNFNKKDKYLSTEKKNSRVRLYQTLKTPDFKASRVLSQREKNTFMQWYHIQQLFRTIDSSKYNIIIRVRPDTLFSSDMETFLAYFRQPLNKNTVYIPLGFDIFHTQFLKNKSVNDQFAFGSYESMKIYCNMFSYLLDHEKYCTNLISEELLYNYLLLSDIHIQRIDIPYTLLLSQCFTISICGDSASGKSSLARLIQETLHFDKTLLFETDRYHKWERGAKEYQQYTHLHPEANHLEKLSTDAYKLKLGQDVFLVDYDHSIGKFTEPQCVEAKNFTIFCGLHTLYLDSLRDIMDLKIYMDTDANLKEYWKIQRDTHHRGASEEQVRKTIATRQSDFREFIEPQKANANIWIRFHSQEPSDPSQLQLEVRIQKSLLPAHFEDKMKLFCKSIESQSEIICFHCASNAISKNLTNAAIQEGYRLSALKDSYEGILQYFLILLTWKRSSLNM